MVPHDQPLGASVRPCFLRRPRATSLNSNLRTIGLDHTLDNEPSIDEGIASGLSRTVSFLEKGQDVVDLGHCSVPLALQAFSIFFVRSP